MVKAPQTEVEARKWAREAVISKSYRAIQHFYDQLAVRGFAVGDALNAIERASYCEPYPTTPKQGGTTWRVTGPALDATPHKKATQIRVGIETYWDDAAGKRVMLVTLFNPAKHGGKK